MICSYAKYPFFKYIQKPIYSLYKPIQPISAISCLFDNLDKCSEEHPIESTLKN